ncbi:MAG: type II secretion system protein [Desulfuromonadales bacterium]
MQREREEELLFRGAQYKDAITRWYKPVSGQHVATPLRDLKDLLHDPRSLTTVRYLRRLYTDPMTGKAWNVIADPVQGISGVASTSIDKPFKITGFPDDLADLAGMSTYSDWRFVYKKAGTPAIAPGAAGTPGSAPPPKLTTTPSASFGKPGS